MTNDNNIMSAIGIVTVLCVVTVVGLIALTFFFVEVIDFASTTVDQATTPVAPTITQQSRVVYVVSTPSTMLFTALKASAAQSNAVNALDREYSVLTTDGDIMVFPNYYSWDNIVLQQSYTCNVQSLANQYGRDVYSASGCVVYKYSDHYQTNYYPKYNYNYYLDNYNYYPIKYYDVKKYPYDNYHYYDRNDGTYNDRYKNSEYSYYHYKSNYYKCWHGTCDPITVSRIPAYVTVHETKPPFFD